MEREYAKKILGSVGWLSILPDSARQEVLDRTVLTAFEKGEAIYQLQDPPGGMYGLVSGRVSVAIAPSINSPYVSHYAMPGFWFGERAVITGEPRHVAVSARSDVTALYLSMRAITEMTEANPHFWRYLAMNAALSHDLTLRAYDDMRIRDPHARVASILMRLAGFQTPSFAADNPCRIDINQTELAEIAALSRNVVSRVLSRLAKDGLAVVGYGYIDLPRPSDLVRLVSRRLDV